MTKEKKHYLEFYKLNYLTAVLILLNIKTKFWYFSCKNDYIDWVKLKMFLNRKKCISNIISKIIVI